VVRHRSPSDCTASIEIKLGKVLDAFQAMVLNEMTITLRVRTTLDVTVVISFGVDLDLP
jgi:hypothetical protein